MEIKTAEEPVYSKFVELNERTKQLSDDQLYEYISNNFKSYIECLNTTSQKPIPSLEEVAILKRIVYACGLTTVIPLGNFFEDLEKHIQLQSVDNLLLGKLMSLIECINRTYFNQTYLSANFDPSFLQSETERSLKFLRQI